MQLAWVLRADSSGDDVGQELVVDGGAVRPEDGRDTARTVASPSWRLLEIRLLTPAVGCAVVDGDVHSA